MTETARFALPLLDAAQAQKHMTMNEALTRIDALAAGRVEALDRTEPPETPADGTLWGVGAGATGDWSGEDGRLALAVGGGWSFADPWEGWRVWDAETGSERLYVGEAWSASGSGTGGAVTSSGGAETLSRIVEIDHAVGSGPASTTSAFIPDKAVVIGVTARVISAIGGASSFAMGVDGSPLRYGSGFGTALGSFVEGVTGQPIAYHGTSALLLTAEGGDFAGGTVRIAAHCLTVSPPAAV